MTGMLIFTFFSMEAPPYDEVMHGSSNYKHSSNPATPPPSYEQVVSFIPPSNVTIGYDRSVSLQFCVHL